jgi:pilus assembly protein Flp/PilA
LAAYVLSSKAWPWHSGTTLIGGNEMKEMFLRASARLQTILLQEEGQDLIEYALVVALIAFAATAGMSTLAQDINSAFTNIGTALQNNT